MTAAPTRNLVVVVGPGRSGTSVITGLLGRLGYVVPQPEIAANVSNPKGFGEPKWVVEFHRQLLKKAKVGHGDARPGAAAAALAEAERQGVQADLSAWLQTQFEIADDVVVKDPRLLWFPEVWSRSAAELGARTVALTMLRHPVPVTKSNQTHYTDLPPATRVASWINCALVTEKNTRTMARTSVDYDALLQDWQQVVQSALDPVQLPAVSTATPEQVAAGDDLVDPTLRRSASSWEELGVPGYLESLAERVYETTCVMAQPGADEAGRQTMDALAVEYADLYAGAENITRFSLNAAKRSSRGRGYREGQAAAEKAADEKAAAENAAGEKAAATTPVAAPPSAKVMVARVVRRVRRARDAQRSGRAG